MADTHKQGTPAAPQEKVFGEGGGLGEETPGHAARRKGETLATGAQAGVPTAINTIAMVGARGGMGKLIAARSRAVGIEVRELGRPLTEADIRAAVAGAELVLVSVPVYATAEVTGLLAPHMAAPQILADVGSVKTLPVAAMVEGYSGPVVGTHPLFGPEPAADDGLRVAVMDGRPGEDAWATGLVADWCRRVGFAPFASTAEEHDRAAAYVQGLNFVTTVAYLASQSADSGVQKYLTPSFTRRLVSAEKLITKDAALFTALFEANPYSHEMIRNYRNFLNIAAGGDIDLLVRRAEAWWTAKTEQKDNP
ncbi:prephenate dehydrogenase [Desulfovibrio sp. DV]|uniref:prephenate dehydrogenase n=1 Tax=Desulfovibrio sp. DV TaxID=1844708 RepID=UPI00094BBDA1|nr:prephenate dehydrogenase [Desulfovibrio sp. DV]